MFCNEIEKIRVGELEVRFHNEISNDNKTNLNLFTKNLKH